jgi:prepilin-type N-terminal cleavage/methylation domain-containing protein
MGTLRRTNGTFRRAGVTLIELLVVLSIIVVLVGLTFTMFSVAERAIDRIESQVASANPRLTKTHPPLRSATPKTIPNQYIVTFNRSVTNPQAEATRLSGAVPASILNVYTTALSGCAVRIQPGDLAALQADPAVARVEQAYYRFASQSIAPTGVRRIEYRHAPRTPPFQLFFPGGSPSVNLGSGGPRNLGPGFNIGGTAAPLKAVAIMDTGIDSSHPDLNVVLSMSFVAGIPNGEDQFGHGSHCAGIVGAKGVNGVFGVFPGVPLWSLRVFGNIPAGQTEPQASDADIISALDFLALNAAQVSVCNMSLGGKGIDEALNEAVSMCVNIGVVMCVAAGNDNADTSDYCPATAVGAICVGALCDTDGLPGGKGAAGSFGDPDDTFTSFSNWGSVVALLGPGEDILSTIPVAQGSYGLKSGTSMATPHVAGLSALVLSTYSATPNSNSGVRNLVGGGVVPQLVINNPAQVLGFLLQESVEQFPGLKANSDPRTNYPLITGRP